MSGEAAAIAGALAAAGIDVPMARQRAMSGGCIHDVRLLTLSDGREVVAKLSRGDAAALFAEEAEGLRALAATGSVVVPLPLADGVWHGRAVLLMTAIEHAPASPAAWERLGADLAALHRTDAGSRYGFATDNHLGATPQPNTWTDDWVTFNREHRLGHQVRLATAGGLLRAEETRLLREVIDQLERLLPSRPRPALLHGDLWSGNALPTVGGRVAVIDPACSIGDGWADIAMMRLFGGIPEPCFRGYRDAVGDDAADEDVEARIAVYQLYHVLNHVNLFGRGYAGQALTLARRLRDVTLRFG